MEQEKQEAPVQGKKKRLKHLVFARLYRNAV